MNRHRQDGARSTGSLPAALLIAIGSVLWAGCDGFRGEVDLVAQTDRHWPMLRSYCVDCHNAAEFAGGIAFDRMQPDRIAEDAEIWEKVVRNVRGRLMPPPGERRPPDRELDGFVDWMEARLDAAHPEAQPGYTVLHRLNRTEYGNAIRDLIALDIEPAELLPVDGTEAGFDNIANALHVTPAFLDQFIDAAQLLAGKALGQAAARPTSAAYEFPSAGQLHYIDGLPLGTRGGGRVEHYFPSDGTYVLSISDMVAARWGENQEHVNTLIATINGRRFFQLDIGGDDDLRALDQIGQPAVEEINGRLKNIPFTAPAGVNEIVVTFLQRSFAESDRHLHLLIPGGGQDAVLKVNSIEIVGPIEATGLSNTPSREAIFSCYPAVDADERPCAEQIVSDLAHRAFRGWAVAEDIERLMRLYEQGHDLGGFEKGVEHAVAGVLAHPKFLFRIEAVPEGLSPGETYALGGLELATRLAFFLWSSVPDRELLDAALAGRLVDPESLEQQVRRMLADSRSEALASSFAFQWLELGDLSAVTPDPELFADVPENLRANLVREVTMFVDSVFRADRSVLDLLTAEHTYLNESLALHYGINNVRGDRFRRVELSDPNRWGLLGKGAALMVSSYPNRTSPVLRGAWLLDHILGTPPPEPPPDVEGFDEIAVARAESTVREILEVHRAIPSCHGCHAVIDPLGFALENFDAVGRWREIDLHARLPIDASGVMADGSPLDGPVALRDAILQRPEMFVQTFTKKLMTYALGRSLTHRDMPTVRRIVRAAAEEDYRMSVIVLEIVRSPQFLVKVVEGDLTTAMAAGAPD